MKKHEEDGKKEKKKLDVLDRFLRRSVKEDLRLKPPNNLTMLATSKCL